MAEKLVRYTCEKCGESLILSKDRLSAKCDFCGTEYYFKEDNNEALILALNRANKDRIRCDFYDAIKGYETILIDYPTNAEANWGLALSLCGIEYVKDARSNQFIPTCHRVLEESILSHDSYLTAIENAALEQRAIFERNAKIIDKLQRAIKFKMEDEEEFEVFISFKSKDEKGRPTKDSVIGRKIRDELDSRGIKTFFSDVTLQDRIGEEYEPIIYKALNTCKAFILIGTSKENVNAVWVKNEWSRFEERVKKENLTSGTYFAVFEGLKSSDLPDFLKGQQGFDIKQDPMGYYIRVADFISLKLGKSKKEDKSALLQKQLEELQAQQKAREEEQKRREEEQQQREAQLLAQQKQLEELQAQTKAREEQFLAQQRKLEEQIKNISTQTKQETPIVNNTPVAPLLKRMYLFLEEKDFDNAEKYTEKVLDLEPEHAEAYLGKLLVEYKLSKREELQNLPNSFENSVNYKKLIRYGSDALKKEINSYLDDIALAKLYEKEEASYKKGLEQLNLKTELGYKNALNIFDTIKTYKDSKQKIEDCNNGLKELVYLDALKQFNLNTELGYKKATEIFNGILNYKDSKQKIEDCNNAIKELSYANAMAQFNLNTTEGYKNAVEIFRTLKDYKDSNQKVLECLKNFREINYLLAEKNLKEYLSKNFTGTDDEIHKAKIDFLKNNVIPLYDGLGDYKNAKEQLSHAKNLLSTLEKKGYMHLGNMAVNLGAEREIKPFFSKPAMAEELTYTFSGNNISITNGKVKGLVANTKTKVTATGKSFKAEFILTVQEEVFSSSLIFEQVDNGYVVSGFKDQHSTSISIPNYYQSLPVIGIKKDAFYSYKNLHRVQMGNCIKDIGAYAFGGCMHLREINLPLSITNVGSGAFNGCKSLTNIYYEGTINNWAKIKFNDCNANPLSVGNVNLYIDNTKVINKITIDKADTIGNFAFYKYGKITDVTIGASVKSIGKDAFNECGDLTNVTIGSGVTSIGANAFNECTKLTSIYYEGTIDNWATIKFDDYKSNPLHIDKVNFYIDKNIVDKIVIDKANVINNFAFYKCKTITSVTIGNSVTSIGENAFNGCESLTSVTLGDNVTSIGRGAFWLCNNLKSITLPNSVTTLGISAFNKCTNLTNVTIGNGVTSIGEYAFYNCTNLTSITIPNSVKSIENCAFYCCFKLANVTMGEGVTSIGSGAFDCCNLKNITIPNGVTKIEENTFHNCHNLTNVTLPNSITSIGKFAFAFINQKCIIEFNGTKKEWKLIEKAKDWDCKSKIKEKFLK